MHELGLVNRLAEPGKALEVAFELAERVLANGPLAVAASKQIVQRSSEWTEEEAWREQMKLARPVIVITSYSIHYTKLYDSCSRTWRKP